MIGVSRFAASRAESPARTLIGRKRGGKRKKVLDRVDLGTVELIGEKPVVDLSSLFRTIAATMSDQQLDCALDLMRRLPPQHCEKNLADLIELAPSLCDELLSTVDQPLRVAKDKETGKDYLICDYNRDGDSYRSPWTNQHDPPLEDGQVPSDRLRTLEIEANAAFEAYRDMYFDGGVSSVYFWELDGYGFAGVVLLKKQGDGTKNVKGCWDSIHVLEIAEKVRAGAHYKLTSTVMLWLQTTKDDSGTMNLGGSLTRQCEQDCTITDTSPHLANIGKMIEEQESKMRMTLNEIYFGKTKKVVSDLRSMEKASDEKNRDVLAQEIRTAVAGRGARND